MSAKTIEHIVLFNVKDDTDPSKVTSMVNGLNGLSSLDQVQFQRGFEQLFGGSEAYECRKSVRFTDL
ncbi:hypothetical protein HHK36_005922 [Tetracentron sinense]|uniref:Stress-response A/B barrel domain-containing protein n=1 Tax=Tetracentron sinense TaxID=13715 RepID=A0A835DKE2_TETSI|nr:hypothetical protein HHK36_005922 [Tetracentron sinense]